MHINKVMSINNDNRYYIGLMYMQILTCKNYKSW